MSKLNLAELTLLINNAEAYSYVGELSYREFSDIVKAQLLEEWHISFIAAAASNCIFATELRLKALIMLVGINLDKIHNVLKLFEILPADVQQRIQSGYNKAECNPKLYIKPITLTLKDTFTPASNSTNSIQANDLIGLLEKHKNGFPLWRYSHEQAKHNTDFHIDISSLNRLAIAINNVIREIMKEKGLEIPPCIAKDFY